MEGGVLDGGWCVGGVGVIVCDDHLIVAAHSQHTVVGAEFDVGYVLLANGVDRGGDGVC